MQNAKALLAERMLQEWVLHKDLNISKALALSFFIVGLIVAAFLRFVLCTSSWNEQHVAVGEHFLSLLPIVPRSVLPGKAWQCVHPRGAQQSTKLFPIAVPRGCIAIIPLVDASSPADSAAKFGNHFVATAEPTSVNDATFPSAAVDDAMDDRRDPLKHYFESRDWGLVKEFWGNCVRFGELPHWLVPQGDEYSSTSLAQVHEAGYREYCSGNTRYTRAINIAFSFAYVGTEYFGWNRNTDVRTLEGDLRDAIKEIKGTCSHLTVAGRTDAGVSAFSQVVNFRTDSNFTAAEFMPLFNQTAPFREGRMRVLDMYRVPRKFNARQATWRRYVYLFPILAGQPSTASMPPLAGLDSADIDLSYLNECLSALKGKSLPYNAFAYGEDRVAGKGLRDECTLLRARATPVSLRASTGAADALAIELVGSRFLRRMVRILVATALREASRPIDERPSGAHALVEIALSNQRYKASRPLPPDGLALCGVGYNITDLQIFRGMPTNPKTIAKLDAKVREMRKIVM